MKTATSMYGLGAGGLFDHEESLELPSHPNGIRATSWKPLQTDPTWPANQDVGNTHEHRHQH